MTRAHPSLEKMRFQTYRPATAKVQEVSRYAPQFTLNSQVAVHDHHCATRSASGAHVRGETVIEPICWQPDVGPPAVRRGMPRQRGRTRDSHLSVISLPCGSAECSH